ncbi:MAG: phosphatase PAP2 family protein [Polyangiaceae bacterium]
MSPKELLARLRPAEWPLLGFALYVAIRAITADHFSFRGVSSPLLMIIPFVAVVTVRLGLSYRNIPWAPELEHRRKLHTIMLLPFLMIGLVCFVNFQTPVAGEGGKFAPMLLKVIGVCFSALVAFVTPVFVWLLYGVHVKRHGRFRFSFFRETGELLGSDLRDWAPPLLLIDAYDLMRPIVSRPLVADRDAELWAIDRALFLGHDPHVLVEHLITPWLSEWLAAVYVFYTFLFPIVLGAVYTRTDKRAFRELSFAVTFALAVGYTTYTFVPAQGPLYTLHFTTSLDFYYLGFVKTQLMDRTRIPRDCFPSLHTCLSLIFLWYAFKNVRWLGWVLAPIVLSIPFACVYLRYHYVVDILAGIVLCGGTIALGHRLFPRVNEAQSSAPAPVALEAEHP